MVSALLTIITDARSGPTGSGGLGSEFVTAHYRPIPNPAGKADVTITISDQDLVQLMLGKLNPQQAFFSGKLKMQGNMGLAMKLREFQSRVGELKAKL
ncbi:hypothetical protein BOX15_Mlig019370g1 [Macrostomum lignano]|uniref:SCP2 domain-containing protein n=1 Tax=Macrostomum lignano TaxID=282301 RepID=A0A267F903_9PLAT|nr:hypothetical protein BOX15_Mlig019370g1 [Macrostomum lignano]